MRSQSFALLIVASLVVIAACGGGGASRTAVSGKVTFDREPLKSGQIIFEPTSGGRMGVAQIADGRYTMPAVQGPSKGSYIVRITANRSTGRTISAPQRGGEQVSIEEVEQFIPAKYNDQSELKTEIGAEAEVVRDFDLISDSE
jgi:hypothetical protein